jgi:ribosome biogenesis protein SSF1/2
MNNFKAPEPKEGETDNKNRVPRHLESLTTTMFQSLFPPINPTATPLSSIRRVLLLNREIDPENPGEYVINLRHYAITTKRTGLSRPLRRLNAAEKLLHAGSKKKTKASLPNLGKLEDIADFMIGGENGEGYVTDGATSGSEVDTDAEVEMLESTTRKVLNKKARQRAEAAGKESTGPSVEKRAVKLIELGPRMKLRMTKVEEGVCTGKTMWHEYIHKSAQEIKEMEKKHEARRKVKDERKKIQKENVERKKAAKEALKPKKDGDAAEGDEEDDEDDEMEDYSNAEWDSEGLEGDAEMEVNEEAEENGEWEDQEAEIAAG